MHIGIAGSLGTPSLSGSQGIDFHLSRVGPGSQCFLQATHVILVCARVENTGLVPPKERVHISLEHLQSMKRVCREEREPPLLSLSSSVGTPYCQRRRVPKKTDGKTGMSFPQRNVVLHGD